MGIYKRFDDGVMYAVNNGVKAWNWTTGKTKTDLANGMLSVAPIIDSVGCLMDNNATLGLTALTIIAPFSFIYSHIFQKRNFKQEKEEIKALEDRLKLPEHKYNAPNETAGGIMFTVGVGIGILNLEKYFNDFNIGYLGAAMIGAGNCVRGTSHYVMRAENLPPRKNVLSRAVDKIKEKLAQKELKPATAPAYGLERLL